MDGDNFCPAGAGADQIPDPIPLGNDLPPVPRFPLEILPRAFRPWVTDAAERMQCPPEFIAVPVMAAAGASIGRRCAIHPKRRDDWLITPNLWAAIVGRPSTMKSPAINAGLGPLRRLEAIASQEHAKALESYEIAAEKFEARKAAAKSVLRGNAKKAMQGGGAAGDEGFPDIGQKPLPPRPTRFITNDATYEAAGAIMGDNPNGILVLRDELVGFLAPLDRQENAAARGFWLESYNGLGGYTFDRIGRGTVRLDAVCAGFVGGVQPARLAAYVKDATSGGAGDDGLLQRFSMTVWPDADPNWEDVDRYPDTAAKRTAAAVFERLVKIEPGAIGASKGEFDELPSLSFDPEAQEAFGEWREKLERDVRREGLHPAIESHFTKYRKLVPALALITHLADAPDGGPVSVDAMVSAMAWDEYLRPHAERVYGSATMPERAAAKVIWNRRATLPDPFTGRDVQRRGWVGLGDTEAVTAALGVLVEHNLILSKMVLTTAMGGRPTVEFRLNPKAASL